jgi:hypothetical protein
MILSNQTNRNGQKFVLAAAIYLGPPVAPQFDSSAPFCFRSGCTTTLDLAAEVQARVSGEEFPNVFHVFTRSAGGKLIWIEDTKHLAIADLHAKRLAEKFEAESFIYSEKDGRIVKRIKHAITTGRAA